MEATKMETIQTISEYIIISSKEYFNEKSNIIKDNVELHLKIDHLGNRITIRPCNDDEYFIFKDCSKIEHDIHIVETIKEALIFAKTLINKK